MSGGSFDYAYSVSDLGEFLEKRNAWLELRDAFESIEADDVAAEIDAMIQYAFRCDQRIRARLARLADVAKAMEWWRSNDWSRADVDKALAEYRREEPAATARGHGEGVALPRRET